MAKILLIDTAIEVAGICLSEGNTVVASKSNQQLKEQAGWLQPAIKTLVAETGWSLADLDAIAVSAGPGSYTGLRVGMASAKGLCYALNKPLIAISTLKIMATAASKQLGTHSYFCPMIDARRMEVFTALYDAQLAELMPAKAMILLPESFDEWLTQSPVVFFGNGAKKYKELLKNDRANFAEIFLSAADGVGLAAEMFDNQQFSNLIDAEPFYIKPFYSAVVGN